MLKRGRYKKYVYEMSCIAITGGVSKMISNFFPQFKSQCDDVQKCMNNFVPHWDHIGSWKKTTGLIDVKINSWVDKYLLTEDKLLITDLLSAVIGILVNLLPTLIYNQKRYISNLLVTIENLISNFEDEVIEYNKRCTYIAQGF